MSVHRFVETVRNAEFSRHTGRITRILSTFLEADGPSAPLDAICEIERQDGDDAPVIAQVVAVGPDAIRLAPFAPSASVAPGSRVVLRSRKDTAPVGDAFLGRAVDAFGRPVDRGPAPRATAMRAITGEAIAPLSRGALRDVAETGIRAIDGLLTLGQGQRIGVFAAAGVGKTSLLTQLANQTRADRCVICLVGERGREVEALWSSGLHPETKAKSVLVAATAEETAMTRIRAADYALSLAEHWRQQGLHVLFLLDSVTRYALALRDNGLAAGEPPTVRALTPGVFAAIPRLVERCGAVKGGGAITAVMSILTETDEVDDPIAEMMRSVLDGHIVLSRRLAEAAHFPAIDIPRSLSRLAHQLADPGHRRDMDRARQALSAYEEARTLIETGIYVPGASADIDRAVALRPGLMKFLKQDANERAALAQALRDLSVALRGEA